MTSGFVQTEQDGTSQVAAISKAQNVFKICVARFREKLLFSILQLGYNVKSSDIALHSGYYEEGLQ